MSGSTLQEQQIHQQLIQGVELAGQGMTAERSGNPQLASAYFDQSIDAFRHWLQAIEQAGLPVPHIGYYLLSNNHFMAARAKSAIGWAPIARAHLSHALNELKVGLRLAPNQPEYHAAAGILLVAMGNLKEAQRALTNAARLDPANRKVGVLMSVIQTAQANQSFQQSEQAANASTSIADWIKLASDVFDLANSAMDAIGKFQSLSR